METCEHTTHSRSRRSYSYRASLSARSSSSGYIYTKGAGLFGALGHGDSLQDVPSFKQVHVHAGAGTDVQPSQHTVGMPKQSSSGENSGGVDKSWQPLSFRQISAGWGHTAAVRDPNPTRCTVLC